MEQIPPSGPSRFSGQISGPPSSTNISSEILKLQPMISSEGNLKQPDVKVNHQTEENIVKLLNESVREPKQKPQRNILQRIKNLKLFGTKDDQKSIEESPSQKDQDWAFKTWVKIARITKFATPISRLAIKYAVKDSGILITKIPFHLVPLLSPKLFKTVPKEMIKEIPPKEIKRLSANHIKEFTPEQIQALTEKQIQALTGEHIQALTPEQIQALTKEQIQALTLEQIQALNSEQILSFSFQQIKMFSKEQLVALNTEEAKKEAVALLTHPESDLKIEPFKLDPTMQAPHQFNRDLEAFCKLTYNGETLYEKDIHNPPDSVLNFKVEIDKEKIKNSYRDMQHRLNENLIHRIAYVIQQGNTASMTRYAFEELKALAPKGYADFDIKMDQDEVIISIKCLFDLTQGADMQEDKLKEDNTRYTVATRIIRIPLEELKNAKFDETNPPDITPFIAVDRWAPVSNLKDALKLHRD